MAYYNYVYVLLAFAFIISTGIHIFSRGFLLTREARTERRNCDQFFITVNGKQCLSDDKKTCNGDNIQDFLIKNINLTADRLCFSRKSKVVIVLIDALKYEFGIYDENITSPLPYQNKLPIIHELMNRHPDRTRLLKFLADPPTTTLQRLKGMTTGSLPTFIDMGSNFATPEINEDNVIDQISRNNLTTVFLGDSTWVELFPKRFKRKFAFPSFNIHDLDTVDNAIMKHLPQELKKTDWDILIAHFLGVDHCGHKYGPTHREMARKLTEMNEVIKKLSETIDDDTMLLIFGDHGMTASGDHGGDSTDETEALLFAYSKQKSFVPTIYENNVNFIQQIDLAPTLATILGVPVPFSNLGTLSLQLLPDVNVDELNRHQLLQAHLWHNAKQIRNYFTKYSEDNGKTFSFDDLEEFETKFELFEHRVRSIFTDEAFINFAGDLRSSLDNVLELCRNIWIKFNPVLMTHGMLVALLGVFFASILIFTVPISEISKVFNNKILMFSFWATVASGMLGYVLHNELGYDEPTLSGLFLSATCNAIIFGYIVIQNWNMISEEMSSSEKLQSIFPRISYTFSILVFFSNSFIIHEQQVLSYLLMGQLIYAVHELRKTTTVLDFKGKVKLEGLVRSTFVKVATTLIAVFVFLRLSHNYFKCREEQGDCWRSVPKTKSKKMDITPFIVLAGLVTISRMTLKAWGNLTGLAPHVLMFKFAPIVATIAASGHFLLSQESVVPQIHLDILAWIVYGVFFAELLIIVISPLLVHSIEPKSNDQLNVSNYANVIPELFRHVRNAFNQGSRQSSGQIPIVYGLATVYSSVFVAFATIFGIVLALLLGAKVSNGLVILVAVGTGILFILSVLQYEKSNNFQECLQPQFILVFTWFLLVNYGFYATSHQPTISQIDWSPAFVGRAANFDSSNVLSAILVVLSTFCSNFLLLIAFPLLVMFPFTIFGIYPKLSVKNFPKGKDKNSDYRRITLNQADDEQDVSSFDVTRGEINLYENEKLFIASVFKVGCKLIILQGLKALSSMLACTVLCRHLMVWKIFAPRFIFEGISSYVSFISIIFGFLFLLRVHMSVKLLVDKIVKKS